MIKSLTSLRGIFILFIFFHHCLHLYSGGGTMAVAFFFVLGGFAMTLGYKDKITSTDFSYKQYLTRRCIKLYPLHWICYLAVLPLMLNVFNLKYIAAVSVVNVTLCHTLLPIKVFYSSCNWVSWYLADTMFFAVVFPFILNRIVSASSKGKVMIATGITVIYTLIAIVIPKDMHHAILYISPYMRLTDFVLGIFLALGYLKLKEKQMAFFKNSVLMQVLVFALIALLVIESCILSEDTVLFAPVYWPFVTLLILITALSEVVWGGQLLLQNKYLQLLGELSFTIFMVHQIILRYATVLFEKILYFENDIVYIVFTLTFTIFLSVVVEKYILKPITQWLTKKIQPSMTVRS